MTKYAMPYLEESRGVILNKASIAGMHSYSSGKAYAYSASKAAVIYCLYNGVKTIAFRSPPPITSSLVKRKIEILNVR